MSEFNKYERSIALILGRFPRLKQGLKSIYSRFTYLFNKKKYKFYSVNPLSEITNDDMSSFFGYYDKYPDNKLGQILACTTFSSTKDKPSIDMSVNISLFDKNNSILFSKPIKAFNWQQGCRAIWLNDELFVHNDYEQNKNRYISVVVSGCDNKIIKTFDYPVQDAFGTDYLLSVNYRRLMTLRPDYGYRNQELLSEEQLSNLQDDGIWKIDYKTGDSKLIVSLEDTVNYQFNQDMAGAFHKFNHVMISPSGDKFIFMHRYLVAGRRVDRLFLASAENGLIKILSDSGMVSHCFWLNEDNVFGYLRGPGNKNAYWIINTNTGDFSQFGGSELEGYGDGHPHVYGDWIITDTYPDKSRMQKLILCNWRTSKVKVVGEFFHGFEFSGESRCDLHPRFSIDGKAVYFDSVFTGKRKLYRMELFD